MAPCRRHPRQMRARRRDQAKRRTDFRYAQPSQTLDADEEGGAAAGSASLKSALALFYFPRNISSAITLLLQRDVALDRSNIYKR
jgi:hypothetical protein